MSYLSDLAADNQRADAPRFLQSFATVRRFYLLPMTSPPFYTQRIAILVNA
jgi:hypothetical protein